MRLAGLGFRVRTREYDGPYGKVKTRTFTDPLASRSYTIDDFASEDDDVDPYELDACLQALHVDRQELAHILR
jgi:hypothetical protein